MYGGTRYEIRIENEGRPAPTVRFDGRALEDNLVPPQEPERCRVGVFC